MLIVAVENAQVREVVTSLNSSDYQRPDIPNLRLTLLCLCCRTTRKA